MKRRRVVISSNGVPASAGEISLEHVMDAAELRWEMSDVETERPHSTFSSTSPVLERFPRTVWAIEIGKGIHQHLGTTQCRQHYWSWLPFPFCAVESRLLGAGMRKRNHPEDILTRWHAELANNPGSCCWKPREISKLMCYIYSPNNCFV